MVTGEVKGYDADRKYYWVAYDNGDAEELTHKDVEKYKYENFKPLRSRNNSDPVPFDEPINPPDCSSPQSSSIWSLLTNVEFEDYNLESFIVCDTLTKDTDLQPFVDTPIQDQPDTVVSLKDYGEKMKFLDVSNEEADDHDDISPKN